MVSSIHTNSAAMSALQVLNQTNRDLETTQNRVASGFEVASARDNSAVFAVAQNMRGDIGSLNAVKDSLNRANSVIDVALAGSEAISDLLIQMREKALAASDESLTTSQRAAYDEDFQALRDQIGTIVSNAEFNGTNLINNSTTGIEALADADGTSAITVQDENLSLSGSIVTLTSTATISTATSASAAVSTIETSIDNLNQALARLGTSSKALSVHSDFVTKLSDVTEKGIGNLVDADLAKESAKLQALQTKQQLGVQALSIANQSSGIALSFFR